jgi:dTDP-4-dehydrorhamnose reductase
VDHCETHPDECRACNLVGPARVARAARRYSATLVFFSTEHVFSDSAIPLSEDDPPAPRSVYARSKTAAEKVIRQLLPKSHLILRTSWVFGPEQQQKNFVYRAVRTLRHGERLVVPEDQYGQPTYAPDLAAAALALCDAGCHGTFHAVGPRLLSRLDFARLIAGAFDLDSRLIRGVPTAGLEQPAPRPLRVPLSRSKLCRILGRDPIRGPGDALVRMSESLAVEAPLLRKAG